MGLSLKNIPKNGGRAAHATEGALRRRIGLDKEPSGYRGRSQAGGVTTASRSGQVRFNPSTKLDTTQVEDRRTSYPSEMPIVSHAASRKSPWEKEVEDTRDDPEERRRNPLPVGRSAGASAGALKRRLTKIGRK